MTVTDREHTLESVSKLDAVATGGVATAESELLRQTLLRRLATEGHIEGRLSTAEASLVTGLSEQEFTRILDLPGQDAPSGGRRPQLSFIIPVFNEEENLPHLLEVLDEVSSTLESYEVLFVDDGSSDSSVEIILAARERDPHVRLIQLSRNFGHQAALSAGLEHASGQAVVLMDADLQDPPSLVERFLEQWRQGYEVVYAVRRKRKEGIGKRASYFVFYRTLRKLADIEIPLDSGDFCLMDRRVVDTLNSLPESSRFLRGLRTWVGFRQVGVDYDRPARHAGEVKYTFRKLVRLAIMGLLAFTSSPLRLASYLGFLTAAGGILYLLSALVARVVSGSVPAGWTSIVAVVLLLGGAQLIVIGVLGEYLAKVYDEVKRRPTYVIGRTHGVNRHG